MSKNYLIIKSLKSLLMFLFISDTNIYKYIYSELNCVIGFLVVCLISLYRLKTYVNHGFNLYKIFCVWIESLNQMICLCFTVIVVFFSFK